MRLLVERSLDTVLDSVLGAPFGRATVLEPASTSALHDTVELAVRRAGPGGTVCVLGSAGERALAAALALYPATRGCLLPSAPGGSGVTGPDTLAGDVDLEAIGRELGVAARAAAGTGTVLVVSAADAMLDRRWRAGVNAGAVDLERAPTALFTVATAERALALIDEQAELIAEGIVPGTSAPLLDPDVELPGDPFIDGEQVSARTLPPITVVVLDASVEAELLLGALAERGVLVIAPRSLLLAAGEADDTVVLRWRVRWDVALVRLLRPTLAGADGRPADGALDLLAVEPGPAHVTP